MRTTGTVMSNEGAPGDAPASSGGAPGAVTARGHRAAARGRIALAGAAIAALAVTPADALSLAGGATGGGGGGGGGGYSGGSGDGSSGGGDGTGIWWLDLLIGLSLFLLVLGIGAVTGWFAARKRRARVRAVGGAALSAHAGDGYWHPQELRERVAEAFFPVQNSWAAGDVEASRPFVSDALYERHRSQLAGYAAQHRVNRIADLRLKGVELVRIHNVTDDDEDRFVARIECSARDWMEDTRTGEVVNGDRESATAFVQYWSFCRHPDRGWVLDEIQQGSEGSYHLSAPLVDADDGPPALPHAQPG
jgi:hypothetical protein